MIQLRHEWMNSCFLRKNITEPTRRNELRERVIKICNQNLLNTSSNVIGYSYGLNGPTSDCVEVEGFITSWIKRLLDVVSELLVVISIVLELFYWLFLIRDKINDMDVSKYQVNFQLNK